ncbi:type II toxin-antitoxin system RelE/ParE family toxin [Dactylosporangium sp. NPDC000555]|uniref:type II toxin-antitoxin system RelE/ParE family toxin n=1 Tax=Dactylosporangium sp. NPDC000555 TaxID=3154260 RepID=UPI0033191C5D
MPLTLAASGCHRDTAGGRPSGDALARLGELATAQFARVAFYIDLLANNGPLLGEPYTKQLDGKLRELRFHLESEAVRVTYWIASGERIVLLTVFRKTRDRETREVQRARRALARCAAEMHTVEEEV